MIKAVISTTQAYNCASVLGFGTSDLRSELDSRANMVVLVNHYFVFDKTGRTCNVQTFSTELGISDDLPIVDGAISYYFTYTKTTYVLIVSNALHVPTMEHNLIPPVIMRSGGLIVIDVPKIHCMGPTIEYHCIRFKNSDLKIPMQIYITF